MSSPNTNAELSLRSRRSFWIWRGLGSLAFATACGVSLRGASVAVQVLGALGLAMFGFFALYALRQLLRRRPRLVLKPAGFEAADLGSGLVPWTDVAEVEAFGSHEAPFVLFLVPDPAPYLARMPWWNRRLAGLLRGSGLPMFSINLIGVDRSAGEVVEHARALWMQAQAQR